MTYFEIHFDYGIEDEATGETDLYEFAYTVNDEAPEEYFASVLLRKDKTVHSVTLFDVEASEFLDISKLGDYGFDKELLIEQATKSLEEWFENEGE